MNRVTNNTYPMLENDYDRLTTRWYGSIIGKCRSYDPWFELVYNMVYRLCPDMGIELYGLALIPMHSGFVEAYLWGLALNMNDKGTLIVSNGIMITMSMCLMQINMLY